MKKKKQSLILVLALLLLLGGGLFLYRSGFFQAATSAEGLQEYIRRFAPYSHLIFFLLQFLSVVLASIPSNISAAAGGVLFGTWPSFWLTFGAVMAGSLLVFWLARVLGRDFADRLVSRRLSDRYQDVIRAKTDIFLLLAFLFPFFPDDVLCILAGLTEIPFRRFALIALCARPSGQRIRWRLPPATAVGYGPYRTGRPGSLSAGDEVRGPGGSRDFAPAKAGRIRDKKFLGLGLYKLSPICYD